MTDRLQRAIEGLYTAFAAVPKPRAIDGCRCCIDDKEVWTMLSVPLRELTATQLGPYASSAMLTVGSPEDFRYYLPRILEIQTTCDGWWPDIEVIGRAMALAGWQRWSERERNGVEDFFLARTEALIEENDSYNLDGLICGAARAQLPVEPLLSRIAASAEAVLGFYKQNADTLPRRMLSNAFWEDDPEATKPVIGWFFSPEILALILNAYGVDLVGVATPS